MTLLDIRARAAAMNLNRIRRIRTVRTLAVQRGTCGQWRKPRHIRIPAMVCRTCETKTAFQTWKPTTVTPANQPEPHPVTAPRAVDPNRHSEANA